jgi:peptidoglycan DL-endopeptidase CwlO
VTQATYSTSASTTVTTQTTPTTTAGGYSVDLPAPGWQVALAFAESQMGKPYQWGGAGPATYDCSGLTMVAWGKAGVYMPHSAQDQYDMTARVPLGDLQPGDLVFFGTPTDVYHVGMYVGGGNMVDAPETGQDVMIQPIYELNLLAGGRP